MIRRLACRLRGHRWIPVEHHLDATRRAGRLLILERCTRCSARRHAALSAIGQYPRRR